MEWFELPLQKTEYAENIYWVFGMVLNDDIGFDADEAMHGLVNTKLARARFSGACMSSLFSARWAYMQD